MPPSTTSAGALWVRDKSTPGGCTCVVADAELLVETASAGTLAVIAAVFVTEPTVAGADTVNPNDAVWPTARLPPPQVIVPGAAVQPELRLRGR